jgi:ribosomal-protein-alanine N-acetyltransferase
MNPAQIIWMIRVHMPQVLVIEAGSFAQPWAETDFLACLKQRNCIGMVYLDGEIVKGFVIYELHRHSLHILNFAVHPDCRLQGVGAAMCEKLFHKLSQQRRTEITVEVRDSNLSAQLFFQRQGFQAVKVIRGHYEPPWGDYEDAYQLSWKLRDLSKPYAAVNRISEFVERE